MCVAVPGKVISKTEKIAVLDFMGIHKEVSIELLKDVREGDYLLVHAGCAIQKIDQDQASEIIQLFEEMKDAF
ncbi:MAG: HypC/HybG/HupF family hydrogenase formation chaperone [Ignavibacteriales bacterium]